MLDWREYERWMSQATKTYELIDADIRYGGYSWACFKAHQAAELALKALLHLVGRPAFGHDISKLLSTAASVCSAEPGREVRLCASLLDKMYIPPRYPDAFPEGAPWEHYTREEAEAAKECARRIIEWVEACASRLRSRGEEEGAGEGDRGS